MKMLKGPPQWYSHKPAADEDVRALKTVSRRALASAQPALRSKTYRFVLGAILTLTVWPVVAWYSRYLYINIWETFLGPTPLVVSGSMSDIPTTIGMITIVQSLLTYMAMLIGTLAWADKD